MSTEELFRTTDVRRRFDLAADTFDGADFVHAHMREGLLDRLDGVVIDAKLVVDLGSAAGAATRRLRRRFRRADIVSLDLSQNMLARCRRSGSWLTRPLLVQADAEAMPFADRSVDVVFCNLLLPWIDDPTALGQEVTRVLRKDGLFAFATLGPDSLKALAHAWAGLDRYEHVRRFPDMHDLGDAMVRAGLRDPVVDVDRLVVTYESTDALFADLTKVGARNTLRNRSRALTGRQKIDELRSRLDATRVENKIRIELELVYGHCWGSGVTQARDEVHIAPHAIPIRQR